MPRSWVQVHHIHVQYYTLICSCLCHEWNWFSNNSHICRILGSRLGTEGMWNVKPDWLVVLQFTWHDIPEDFNLHLTPSNSWLLCKYLQIFLQGFCVMLLLYVNDISCSRQAHRYNLQVVERYYYVLSFLCVISLIYKTYNLHMWKWKFIVCNWWVLWSECTFCYREQMYFV
jgi:hypothetical protein